MCIHCFIADSDNEDIGFGIEEENDGNELIRFTQDKNATKHDYIPSRTKKIGTESYVVKRPSSKKKSGKNLSLKGENILLKFNEKINTRIPTGPWNDVSYFTSSMMFLNDKDDISYHRKMIGWFIEIYQGKKFVSMSNIVVFPNGNA